MSTEPFAFVLMPFDSAFDDVYKIGIQEAAARAGVKAQRLDDQIFPEGMVDRIFQQIEQADIIIADMSGRNPNVFFEVGYARAKEKLCIHITSDVRDIPFDLQHVRHIVYGNNISLLREKLSEHLEWAVKQTRERLATGIRVKIQPPRGSLSTTEYIAKIGVEFTLDLFNESEKKAAELDAFYLYSKSHWSVVQDGADCAYTDSDIAGYQYRYYIKPPASRLAKGAWAQLSFRTERIVAELWMGQEILNEYKIDAAGLIRLVTSNGNFDHPFKFQVACSEIPF